MITNPFTGQVLNEWTDEARKASAEKRRSRTKTIVGGAAAGAGAAGSIKALRLIGKPRIAERLKAAKQLGKSFLRTGTKGAMLGAGIGTIIALSRRNKAKS